MTAPISLHPGRVLLERFLNPLGITQATFAEHVGWTYARLNEIINNKRGVTADSALTLSEALPETTPEFWLDIQRDWDLYIARQSHRKVTSLNHFASIKK